MNEIKINEIQAEKTNFPVAPYWDIPTQSLYWVNFISYGSQPVIFRYSYNDNTVYPAYLPGVNSISFIVANEDGTFTIGTGNTVQTIQWDGLSSNVTFISNKFSLDTNLPSALVAYARSSPEGRFFGGTISSSYCVIDDFSSHSVYRYDKQNGLVKVISGTYTVGIAFDPVKKIMYHLAPCRFYITAYDWNPETGDICKIIIDFFSFLYKFSMNSKWLRQKCRSLTYCTEVWVYSHQWAAIFQWKWQSDFIIRQFFCLIPGNGRFVIDLSNFGVQTKLNAALTLEIDTNGNLYTATQNGTILIMDPV